MQCVVPENIHPPHGRDFAYGPPSPLDFPKSASQNGPHRPLQKFHFFHTPLEILSFLVETKNKLFFSARYQILILTVFFFRKIWWIL